MKSKIVFTSMLIALSLNLYAKDMLLRTDEGSITIDIAESKDGKVKSELIISILKSRIDRIEYDYITKLGSLERAEALKELKNIRILIASLPRDASIIIDDQKKDQVDIDRKEMSDADFKALSESVKNKRFGNEKVAIIKIAAENNYFSLTQLLELLKNFRNTETDDIIETIKAVYPKVTDRKNKYKLFDYFKFQSDKDRVKKILDNLDKK